MHRATHQIVDDGAIYCDPLAIPILGADPGKLTYDASMQPWRRTTRLFVASRHRFAEDIIQARVARGVRQVVVLGAGLDTFGCRNPYAAHRVRVIELDQPGTQALKRERLRAAAIAVPDLLTLAPIDFEHQALADVLKASPAFEPLEPAIFVWLGVTYYLTRDAVFDTLRTVAASGSEIVFDYVVPAESLPPDRRQIRDQRAAGLARIGEPWLSSFDPPALERDLRAIGFGEIEDLGMAQISARYFASPTAETLGGRLLRARAA